MTLYEVKALEKQIIDIVEQIENLQNELNILEHKIHVHDNARILLNLAKTSKIKNKKDFILHIINTAIQDIFESDIEIKILSTDEDDSLIGKSKNLKIKYDLVLYENSIEIGRNEKLLSSNGGGILSVVSFLLKILTGYIYSQNKFYVFDESLAQVSERFQERLSLFIRNFCEQYGFTILLITHNPKLSEHSHIDYLLGNKAAQTEKLKRLAIVHKNINNIELNDDYYYLKIKNFQSIKNIEIDLKGFVTISGSNNIGKSALIRAINSVIYNAFQENYLRLGEKKSEIIFGHINTSIDKWVKLIYQSKKVTYEFWDGEKFTGKKLAQDKINEKLAQIGFKQINVSSMYKNWRSNVKDQVERVYITTQYDSLYVIGSKSNDNDKLFNFLFNAETIANAIININYDIREMQMRYNELQTQITDLKRKKELLTIKHKIVKNQYLINLIKEVQDVESKINRLNIINESSKQIFSSINNKIQKIILTQEYFQIVQKIKRAKFIKNYFSKFIQYTKIIIDKLEKQHRGLIVVHTVQNLEKKIDRLYHIVNILSNIKQAVNNLIISYNTYDRLYSDINVYKNTLNTIQVRKREIEKIKKKIDMLATEYGLEQCRCCGGIGFHSKG